jgi:outer membrane protein OmpA-like peptidoglycan-associated protein
MPFRAAARERAALAGLLAAWLAPLWLGGCAVTQRVVLVPDPDGRVGTVEVTTAGGTQRLAKAGDMTSVSGSSAPSDVTTADPAWIQATFGEVLAAEPAPPERFILYFETGSADLAPKSRAAIPAVAAAIKRRGAIAVSISGHTDAAGSEQLNERLALQRAERVKALLVEQGVAAELMSVTSHGKGNPAVPTPEGAREPRNRRVEAVVQ